jgi:flagellum-specific peptidoglycan hydrolase FlgJ
MRDAARRSGHIWPAFAACEAALESGWGSSRLAAVHNLFGMKQHLHPQYGTLSLPTREFLRGGWTVVSADWIEYPDDGACFADRMATLQMLAPRYAHYAAALAATTGEDFINQVSQSWSTDPNRAEKVLEIYQVHQAALTAAPAPDPAVVSAPAEGASAS